jgi:hypothetical protein
MPLLKKIGITYNLEIVCNLQTDLMKTLKILKTPGLLAVLLTFITIPLTRDYT